MSAIPNLPEQLTHDPNDKFRVNLQDINGVTGIDNTKTTLHKANDDPSEVKLSVNGNDSTKWQLHDTPIENLRPIKVVVIGAGFSGIYCGIRIPEKIRNCTLTIYEKNAGVGGTWYENRYPGAACDIPSHSYQYSFNPKPDWSSLYSPSHEIRAYIEETAEKYSVNRFIKLQHEVKECTWQEAEGKWHLRVQTPSGEVTDDECDVLVNARGLLNNKQWPDIQGLRSFGGEIMHSAGWNEEYDFHGKRVGVIGVGSSAIQIIPKLQKQVGEQGVLNCFIRGKTWISPPLAQQSQDALGLEDVNFSREQIERFKRDPDAWFRLRLKIEADANNIHAITLKGTPFQLMAQQIFEDGMRQRLQKKPEYFEWIKPGFAPGCRRLTPGPGFLEAMVEDNVNFVRDQITRIESRGVVTEDEKLHELDVLVCATGFYASAAPPFKVTGADGRTLQQHWHDRAYNYMSLATDGFPNHFLMLGPNGAIGEGSLTMMMESTGDYIVKAIRKIQKENIRAMRVKPARVRDFTRYCDEYFKRTVYMDDCASWYRKDGQGRSGAHVTGLWPGGTLHCIEALRSPRWEDYEYEYAGEGNDGAEVNELAWLGNGWAMKQLGETTTSTTDNSKSERERERERESAADDDDGGVGEKQTQKPAQATERELAFYICHPWQEREIGVPVYPLPEANEQFVGRPYSY